MIHKGAMTPINTEKLILASASPRRKDLMEQAGLEFDISAANIDEDAVPYDGDPGAYVQILSAKKAETVALRHPDVWTIGADTIVVVDNAILGKPKNLNTALSMLGQLSDRTHSVYTGFCIMGPSKEIALTRAVETQVRFKALSQEEITWYANTGEPYDKAGGYGIQGIGAFMVQEISGSYSNVVGLPVCELIQTLAQLKIIHF